MRLPQWPICVPSFQWPPCDALQFKNLSGAFDIKHPSYLLAAYHLLKLIAHHMPGDHVAPGDKIHLSELLLKGHAPHQLVDKHVHPAVCIITLLTTRTHQCHADQGD